MRSLASGRGLIEARTAAHMLLKLFRANADRDTPFQSVAGLRRFELGADRTVIGDDGPREHVWIVRSGLLRLQHFLQCGRRRILSFAEPREMVGVNRFDPNRCSVETVTDCILYRVDRHLFDAGLGDNTELRREIYRHQDQKLESMRAHVWMLRALSPEQRLCNFLVKAARLRPRGSAKRADLRVTVVLPRSDLADFLGTTVESISRITRRMARRGLIEIISPADFRIRDLPALMDAGNVESVPSEALPSDVSRSNWCPENPVGYAPS